MHFLMFFVFWVFFWGGGGIWDSGGGGIPPQEIAGNNTGGQGADLVAGFARCECRFRHGRSLHPARPVFHLLRAHEISFRLDAVVHRRSHADSSLLWI